MAKSDKISIFYLNAQWQWLFATDQYFSAKRTSYNMVVISNRIVLSLRAAIVSEICCLSFVLDF
jgi:hypothetical protein